MRAFPPAEELQFLIGLEIQQIALDPWSVQFRFANGGQISAEGRIEHVEGGLSHSHDCQERVGNALYLHQLAQHSITTIGAEPFCLSLSFTGGAVLRIFSELGPHECGQIYPPEESGKDIIVF